MIVEQTPPDAMVREAMPTGSMLYRTGEVVARAADDGDSQSDTLELSISSSAPLRRFGMYHETLDHRPRAVDLKFIRRDGKILTDHNSRNVDAIVGRVDDCWLDGDKCRARMVWDDSDRAKEIRRKVENGMLRTVSIGYRVHDYKIEEHRDGKGAITRVDVDVTRWEPMEVSFVAVPADSSVGVGRAQDEFINYFENVKGAEMPSEKVNPPADVQPEAPDVGKIQREARQAEQDRIRAILEVGERHGLDDMARESVESGESYDAFNKKALAEIASRNDKLKTEQPARTGDVDLTADESARFSLRKLILAQAHGPNSKFHADAAFEREVCEAAYTEMPTGYESRGSIIPDRVLSGVSHSMMSGRNQMTELLAALGVRAPIDTGSTTTGAALVADNMWAGSFIGFLYNASILQQMGIMMIPGLVGNVEIPRQASKASPGEVAEGGAAPESILTLDQVQMSAKHVAVTGSYTRNMMLQSTPAIENLIRMDFARSMALRIDYLGIYGSGASNQPRGIKNTTGVNTQAIANDGEPSYAEIIKMIQQIKADNAMVTDPKFLFTSTIWAHMATAVKASSSITGFILNAEDMNKKVAGFDYHTSELLTDNEIMAGCWNQLMCGEWGGLDVITDPYSQSTKGNTVITMFKSIDFAVRHPESFCYGT